MATVLSASRRRSDQVSTNSRIALILYGMTAFVLFGAGTITLLSFPDTQELWKFAIPLILLAALVIAIPVARLIAPKLRSRFGRAGEPR